MAAKKKDNLYSTTTIYFKKHEAYFIETCKEFAKEKFGKISFSEFISMCVKDYVNSLPKEDKKLFEDIAWRLVEQEKPKAAAYVDKFLKKEKFDRLKAQKAKKKQKERQEKP